VIRLAVRVEREHAEAALAELLVFSPNGLEEIDVGERAIEYVLYGAAGELPSLPVLEASIGGALVTVQTSEIADDWSERWREHHRPLLVAGRLYVRPPWSPPASEPGLVDLVIEPAQAFGTGAHATTRMCLELLAGCEPSGSLLDVGCGSGVLAIAAAKLGFAPVVALDNDPASVTASIANAAANGVALDVRRLDLRRDELPPAATIVANLLLAPLLTLSQRIIEPPQTLIASGLLAEQGDRLAAEIGRRHGLGEARRLGEGDWLALLLSRGARVSS
jgi:ribosomal protein L11 methyltransferase